MERTRTSSLTRNFYIRRAFRIYPLCWVSILLVLTTGLTDIPHDAVVEMGWRGILANFALLQNITHCGDVLGPLWSLPWEVQMYLVLPMLFLLMKKSGYPLLLAVSMWFCLTTLAVLSETYTVPSILHALIFPPMFFGGMVAFYFCSRIQPRIPSFAWTLVVPMLLVGRCLLLHGISLQNPYNVVVNAAISLFLGFAIPLFKSIHRPLITHFSHLLAKYSYGIYLFHIPALAFIYKYFASYSIVFKIGALVVITGAVSVLLYHTVEHPLIQFGKHVAERFERPRQLQVKEEAEVGS
jgi:peptidoglycan/LPS O-acetylase OafA/YrhL